MLRYFEQLDRRWIFLAMGLSVAVPILLQPSLPEVATPMARKAFATIGDLPDGSRLLLSFDFDPGSEPELGPMATSLVRQCAMKKHRLVFIALWPLGPQMIDAATKGVLATEFPHYRYGEDWVNMGFQTGNEAVMKQLKSDVPLAFPRDINGTAIGQIPLMKGVRTALDFDAIVAISAGYPGAKEWVQYVVSPNRGGAKPLRMVAGCTGVQTPQLYPYYPGQLDGLIGAIKGAAEYELLVNEAAKVMFPAEKETPPRYLEAQRRMGPQLVAHLLMVSLIILGNVIFLSGRRREVRS